MNIRPLNNEDYDNILKGWWHEWSFQAPCREFLPDMGTGGYIVFDEEVPVCSGYIYKTNSGVAWITWILSNRSYRKKPQRKEAINLLIREMTDVCKSYGFKYVFTAHNNQNLNQPFEQLGYIKGSHTQEMIKKL